MNRTEQTPSGKPAAKLGMWLIIFSYVVLRLLIILEVPVDLSVFIFLGGFGTVGLVMIFAALIKERFRARWVFWFLLLYAFILLQNPPVGTVLALFTFFYLIKERSSFFPARRLRRSLVEE